MRRLIVLALAGFVAGSMLLLTACGSLSFAKPAATHRVPASPSQSSTQPTTPSQSLTQPPAPAPTQSAPASSYPQDITDAGIVAPVNWINHTGQILCSDWASGMSWTQTDNAVLTPGGIYPNHLALYDEITARDLCPAYSGGN
jgi:hypothetical protein